MPDWPKDENKDEIDRAIKKCLEVIFVLYLEICFLRKI